MPLYQVRARDQKGRLKTSVCSAENPAAALSVMREAGLFAIEAVPLRPRTRPTPVTRARLALAPVRADDRALVFRHLAPLVKAGVSLPEALSRVAQRLPDRRLADLCRELSAEVGAGAALSQSLSARSGFFPRWVAGTLEAAEQAGKADELLPAIRDELSQEKEFSTGLAVPIAYLRLCIVLSVVVPTLPFLMNIGVSGWAMLAACVTLGAGALVYGLEFARRYALTSPRAVGVDDFAMLFVPGLGAWRRQLAALRFARVLRALLMAQLPLGQAWEVASKSAGSRLLSSGLDAGRLAITQGRGLAQALAASGLFAGELIQAAQQAEERGRYDEFLDRLVADSEGSAGQRVRDARGGVWRVLLLVAALVIAIGAVLGMMSYVGNVFEFVKQLED